MKLSLIKYPTSSGGGSTSPSAPNESIQFNNSGTFGGNSAFLYDQNTQEIQVTNADIPGILRMPGTGSITNPFVGKTMVMIGDSITFGIGATSPATRFSTLVNTFLRSIELNEGISSSTLEDRLPVNPIGGVNFLSRMTSDVPVYSSSTHGLLVLEFGMNDYGYTGVNYTPANYTTDYNTALDFCITTQGWPANKILILSPGYVSDASFAFYAGLSGLAAPTRVRMLQFVAAAQGVATTRGTLYIDMYQAMLAAGGDSLVGSDGVHPLDIGHLVMAQTIVNSIGGISAGLYPSILMGDTTAIAVDAPSLIDMGASYSNTVGDSSKAKILLYHDNVNGLNNSGFGITAGHMEFYLFTLGSYDHYIGGTLISTLSESTGLVVSSDITANGNMKSTGILHIGSGGSNGAASIFGFTDGNMYYDNDNPTGITFFRVAGNQIFSILPQGKVQFAAPIITSASIRLLPSTGISPSIPDDGDIWYDGTNLKMQIGGVTKTFTLV